MNPGLQPVSLAAVSLDNRESDEPHRGRRPHTGQGLCRLSRHRSVLGIQQQPHQHFRSFRNISEGSKVTPSASTLPPRRRRRLSQGRLQPTHHLWHDQTVSCPTEKIEPRAKPNHTLDEEHRGPPSTVRALQRGGDPDLPSAQGTQSTRVPGASPRANAHRAGPYPDVLLRRRTRRRSGSGRASRTAQAASPLEAARCCGGGPARVSGRAGNRAAARTGRSGDTDHACRSRPPSRRSTRRPARPGRPPPCPCRRRKPPAFGRLKTRNQEIRPVLEREAVLCYLDNQQLRSAEMVERLVARRDAIHRAVEKGNPAAYAVRQDRIERTWPCRAGSS